MEYPVRSSFIKFGKSYTPHWNLDALKEEIEDSELTQASAEDIVRHNPEYAKSGFFHQTLTRPTKDDVDLKAVKKFMPTGTWNIFFVAPNYDRVKSWEAVGVVDPLLHKVDEKYLEEPHWYEWDTEDHWVDDSLYAFNYSFDIDPTCSKGFVKLTSEGLTKTVSWERQSDGSFIMTDFDGRSCRVASTGEIHEIFESPEDLLWTVYAHQRNHCTNFSQHSEWTNTFKNLADDLRENPNQTLPRILTEEQKELRFSVVF